MKIYVIVNVRNDGEILKIEIKRKKPSADEWWAELRKTKNAKLTIKEFEI